MTRNHQRLIWIPDNDSAVHELATGHYEDDELADLEQDTSVTDPDQPSTEE